MVEEHVETAYRVRMTLSILNFRTADSGRYQCQATNEWGQSNGTIRLYGTDPIIVSINIIMKSLN